MPRTWIFRAYGIAALTLKSTRVISVSTEVSMQARNALSTLSLCDC